MTITEKILAAHAGLDYVQPGDLIMAKVDGLLANDTSAPIAIQEFKKMGVTKVFDREKLFLTMDHFTPCATLSSAAACKTCRDFARENDILHFYDVGRVGIEHAFLPEQGMVVPGQIVMGADSHTCTYGALGAFSTGVGSTDVAGIMALGETWLKVPESIRFRLSGRIKNYVSAKDLILYTIGQIGAAGALYKAMEFCGEVIDQMPMSGRFTICNMAIEAGAKNGIIQPDAITKAYVKAHNKRGLTEHYYESDPDAQYAAVYEWDVSDLEPQIARPSSPDNVAPISACCNISIDQVVIGSCTNGRLEDLRAAAAVIRGKKVHPYVRTIVIPATNEIYQQAEREGLIDDFIDAGAIVSAPTCGPCFGGHMGLLADGERAVSTTNRNFVGRMGSTKSEVYLANPAVAAASAVAGRIARPEEVL